MGKLLTFLIIMIILIVASIWYFLRKEKEPSVYAGDLSFKCSQIKNIRRKFTNQLCKVKENFYGFCCEKDGTLYECDKKTFSPGEFVQIHVKFPEPEKLASYCFYSDIIDIFQLINACDANITSLDAPKKRCIMVDKIPLVATGMSVHGFIPNKIGKIKILELNITKDSTSENFVNLEVEVK